MNAKLQEAIYRGISRGRAKMQDAKVEKEYTTVIVQPGQDLEPRARGTRRHWASVLAVWGLGLLWALSAFSPTTFASGPLAPTVTFTVLSMAPPVWPSTRKSPSPSAR